MVDLMVHNFLLSMLTDDSCPSILTIAATPAKSRMSRKIEAIISNLGVVRTYSILCIGEKSIFIGIKDQETSNVCFSYIVLRISICILQKLKNTDFSQELARYDCGVVVGYHMTFVATPSRRLTGILFCYMFKKKCIKFDYLFFVLPFM